MIKKEESQDRMIPGGTVELLNLAEIRHRHQKIS